MAIGIYYTRRLVYWTSHSYFEQNELNTIFEKIGRKLFKNEAVEDICYKNLSIRHGKVNNYDYVLISSEDSDKYNNLILKQICGVIDKQGDTITISCMAALDKLVKSDISTLEQKTVFINDQVEPNRLFDTEDLDKLDALLAIVEAPSNIETLHQIYNKTSFSILKDDRENGDLPLNEKPKTATSKRSIDNISLHKSNGNAVSTISIRHSVHKEKAMKIKVANSQLTAHDEEQNLNKFSRPVPKILVKEKMEIVVKGIQIQNKEVKGSISVDNITKSVDYYLEMENDYWFNKGVINHTLNDCLPSTVNLIQEQEGLFFNVSSQYSGNSITLYEYKINPKLIDIDTVPFMVAFKQQAAALALKLTFNSTHLPNIINFQLKIEFSDFLDQDEITSSHLGTVIGKYYLIIFEQEELETNSLIVHLSFKNKTTKCINVKVLSSLSTSFASLQPQLTNISQKNAYSDKVSVLDVEYILIIN